MTLEELAESSGVSARAISDMERGHSRAPQARTLTALADALGLTDTDRAELVAAARSGRTRSTSGLPGPCELPRAVGDFAGRRTELDLLRQHAGSASADRPTPVALVHGAAGLGKTALAVRAAEDLRSHFPDGQFYVDLRGAHPTPLAVGEALTRLLKALGLNSRRVADNDDERASQLRALLRERSCLLVLDNAAHEAQLRPLLPATGPGMALVTSRRTLGGLEGVHRLPLGPLAPAESAGLLRTIAGPASARAGDEDVDKVARLCGNLPLALRIAGTRLASRPGWTMAHLADRLSDADRRLANLSIGDLAVEAAFALSYAQLSEPTRTMFRRLAHVPGTDFAVPLAAVLTQSSLFAAEDEIDQLVELGLLQADGTDRYRFHDLIRLFAGQRLRAEEPADTRATTEDRMVDWLLDTAIVAGRWYEPAYGAPPADWQGLVPLATADEAQRWLQAESDNWFAALRAAAAEGQHQRVVDVAEAMHWYSDRAISWRHWSDVYGLSRAAAAKLPDRHQEITHLNYLAWAINVCEGQYEDSAAKAMEAYRLACELGDVREQSAALFYAGQAWRLGGNSVKALWAWCLSQELADEIGDHDGYVQIFQGIGVALSDIGMYDEAIEQFRSTLREVELRPVGSAPAQVATASARVYLAETLCEAARWREALAEAVAAMPLLVEFGELGLLGHGHLVLGRAHAALGARTEAHDQLTRALGLLEDALSRPALVDQARAELAALAA